MADFSGVRMDDLAAVQSIRDSLTGLPVALLSTFDAQRTALIIIDMVNGFTREGPLHSGRILALIPEVVRLAMECQKLGIPVVCFSDNHDECSPEFLTYPRHCASGSEEAEVVAELKAIGGYELITKNSTNPFLEDGFRIWQNRNPGIDSYVIAGDCTDICVEQLAVTLKADFNRRNMPSDIVVPANAVNTFDAPGHGGDFMHAIALHKMLSNGVRVVAGVI